MYHLVLMQKDFRFNSEEPKMKILSDTVWLDLNKATDRARSMIHNEFLNSESGHGTALCELEEVTTDKLKDGIIFMMDHEEWNHEDITSTLWTDKFIVLIKEKDLIVNVLANLCNKLNPGVIDGKSYLKEGS